MRRSHIAIAVALFALSVHAATRPVPPLDRAPPEAVYEVTPPERPGYTWTQGCWHWDGKRMVWHPGNWVKNRAGYTWVPDGWEKRADKWYFAQGYWQANEDEEEYVEDTEEPSDAVAGASSSTKAVTAKKKVAKATKKKRVKKNDYANTRLYPKIEHH